MKIAYVYESLFPESCGGAERRYFEIAKKLSLNHDVHFFCQRYSEGESVIKKNGQTFHGILRVKSLYKTKGTGSRRSIFRACRFSTALFFSLFKHRFDVVDVSQVSLSDVLVCLLYGKIKKVPIVVTWHEVWDKKEWQDYLGKAFGFFAYLLQKVVFRLTKNIIFVSKQGKKQANLRNKNQTVIQNGVQLENFKDLNQERSIDLLFVGRLIPDKRPLFFIEVINELFKSGLKVKAVLVGRGPRKEEVLKKIMEDGLSDFIEYKESVLEDELLSLYKKSKILIAPSKREGFGLTVLEALGAGMIVLISNEESNAANELLIDKNFGKALSPEVMVFTNEIKNVLADFSVSTTLRNEFLKKYDWDVISKSALNFYQKALL